VIVKMIVEKQMECRLAGETAVLGENLPQGRFCPSQNPTWPDPGLNPGRRGGKPATNRLSYGAACTTAFTTTTTFTTTAATDTTTTTTTTTIKTVLSLSLNL
jgi:hypothetical protein